MSACQTNSPRMVDHYCPFRIRSHQWKVVTVSCPFPDSSVILLHNERTCRLRHCEHSIYSTAPPYSTSTHQPHRRTAPHRTSSGRELLSTRTRLACMDPKSVGSSSKTASISKTERHLYQWAKAQVATFPERAKLTGKPLGRLDSRIWSNFVREYPNPTLFTDTNLARPQDKLVSEFHCAFSRVAFLDYTLFWHHIYPKIVCPKCKSCEHTTLNGRGDTLRLAASKEGTIYVYYRKYTCSKCGGFNACDPDLIAQLPEVITSQLPIVVTSKHSAICRCDLDQLERDACTGTPLKQVAEAYKETNYRR